MIRSVLFIFLFLVACTRSEDYSNSPVVRVNDSTLTVQGFSDLLARKLSDLPASSARDEGVVRRAKDRVVQDFIISAITKDAAARNNVFVRKEVLDAEVAAIRGQYPDDLSFRKSLADSKITYREWEERVRQTLLEKLVVESISKKLPQPSEQEIKSYYEANKSEYDIPARARIRRIVLDTEEDAKKINKELAAGKKFESLVRQYSRGAEASAGGDLGWIDKGASEMFDYAFRLGVGQKSPVMKTPEGYIMFQLIERSRPRGLTYAEARPRALRSLLARREQDHYTKWLEAELLSAKVFKDEALLNAVQVFARSAN